jgi:hypothetical protein
VRKTSQRKLSKLTASNRHPADGGFKLTSSTWYRLIGRLESAQSSGSVLSAELEVKSSSVNGGGGFGSQRREEKS